MIYYPHRIIFQTVGGIYIMLNNHELKMTLDYLIESDKRTLLHVMEYIKAKLLREQLIQDEAVNEARTLLDKLKRTTHG